jgi:alkanesulfonate monooxygenase SsuD/methylene tetrahydromethanopterin reductase-like flavin-dependent oxidoreductase (luciferase family)
MTDCSPMRYSIFSVQDHYPTQSRSVAGLYQQVVEQAELADRLGYDTFFVAEHHFHEYGVVPNPAVMLSTLAQRTGRIRLGSAISILTFHHPLTVAESYAMVDVLSGGRLVLGVGSGYLKHEFEGYCIDGSEKRDRFDEGLEVVTRALAGERVTFHGRYVDINDVALNVRPLQQPTPPIHVAVLRKEAAYHVGRKGQRIVFVPYASVDRFDEIAELIADFRRGQMDGGVVSQDDDIQIALHTHVAGDDAEARRQAEGPFDRYVESRLYAKRQTYDDIMASELSLMGGVDTVTDKLVRLYEMGARHVMMLHNFGLMDRDLVLTSMRRAAQDVMPRVHDRVGAPAAA